MKLLVGASTMLAFLIPAAATGRHKVSGHRSYCHHRLFTVREGKRAANYIYRGTRKITRHNLRTLGQIERCQRNPAAQWFVRWYDHHQAVLHDKRVYDASHPWNTGVATMNDDSGATASGEHFTYGFASCGSAGVGCWAWGTKVKFCYAGKCITGIREDNGPYGDADFDLNNNMGYYLGVDGPGRVTLRYRVVG